MFFGRILADATARRLNGTAPKPTYFRKALWEQSPDPSELPDPRLIDFLCPLPEEKADSQAVNGTNGTNKPIALTTAEVVQDAITVKKVNPLIANNVEKSGAIANGTATHATTAKLQAATPRPKANIPRINEDFFIFAAVSYGLGAWNQPDL